MKTSTFQQLAAARAKVAALEQQVAKQLSHELAKLPASYGFNNVEDFVSAVRAAAGKRGPRAQSAATGTTSRKPRAKITDKTRAAVKKLVAAGKSGAEIAKQLDISLPSVQNIKKSLGLVKARK